MLPSFEFEPQPAQKSRRRREEPFFNLRFHELGNPLEIVGAKPLGRPLRELDFGAIQKSMGRKLSMREIEGMAYGKIPVPKAARKNAVPRGSRMPGFAPAFKGPNVKKGKWSLI